MEGGERMWFFLVCFELACSVSHSLQANHHLTWSNALEKLLGLWEWLIVMATLVVYRHGNVSWLQVHVPKSTLQEWLIVIVISVVMVTLVVYCHRSVSWHRYHNIPTCTCMSGNKSQQCHSQVPKGNNAVPFSFQYRCQWSWPLSTGARLTFLIVLDCARRWKVLKVFFFSPQLSPD